MAEETITTDQLIEQTANESFSTEELFGKVLPAKKDPTLPEYIKYKITMDKANATRGEYGSQAMWGKMDTKQALKKGNSARDYWVKEAGPYSDVEFKRNPFKYVAGEAAQLIPYMISSQVEGLKHGLTMGGGFAAITAVAGQAGPQATIPEEIITVPAAFSAGMNTGYHYGIIKNILDREGGGLYLDMVEKGISEDTARMMALAGGTMIGVIELAQFKLLGKPFQKGFAKMLQTKVGRAAISKAMGRYVKTVGMEVPEEVLQEATSLLVETIAAFIDKQPDAMPTKEEWTKRLIETAQKSIAGLAVVALPGGAVDVALSTQQKDAMILDEIKKGEEKPMPEAFVKEPETQEAAPTPTEAIETSEIAPEAPETPTVEPAAKKPTVTETLEKRLSELQESEEFVKDKKQVIKNEIKAIEETIKVIEEAPEYSVYGENIFPDKKEVLKDLISQKKFQQSRLSNFKIDKITKTEPTYIKQRLADIKRGIREGRGYTLKQVKKIQEEMIEMISVLDAKDKAKFIKTIKNIQTPEQLDKAIKELIPRIQRVQDQTKKAKIGERIKKEITKTKPVKQGQRKVGKYDYESNKFFDEVRGYMKLNQAKAQEALDSLPEPQTQLDLIKARMLSLKANGAAASLQIYEQVLKDIKMLKELGAAAKDDADFDKALQRQENVEEALVNIDKINANKKTFKTKIGNAYRRGFSNIYSMFNSIAGSNFAKKYDPEVQENARNTAVFKKTTEVADKALKIYGRNNVMGLFESMATKDYTLTDIQDGLTLELTKLDLVDIYNSIKNEKRMEDYYEAYGEGQIETLLGNLTQADLEFADMLMDNIQEYKDILNERHIETTGRDMGFVDNYWPGTSEYQVSVIDDMRVQGETPSALKEKAKGPVIPKPKNAWYKAQKHISEAEHVKHLSREHEALKRMFTDRKVKHAIEQKFGEKVYETIMEQIDNISLNKHTDRIDAISGVFQKGVNNWVTAKIALNPSTYVRQLMSVGNYMEDMNVAEWTKLFFEGIANPKKTLDYMWQNAPFLEARFKKGSTEAINEAIRGAESISANKASYVKALTFLVRSGDITAIVFGGYPVAKTKGFQAFESATLKAQQSGLSSSLSHFQNSRNPFTRLFLAFKNTSNQYFRKQVDAIISYANKDISATQLAKTTLIYSVIQPIAYVSAGFLTREAAGALGRLAFGAQEEEDMEDRLEKYFYDILTQLVVSPVNAIPLLDGLVNAAMRKLTDQRIYNVISLPWLDDIEAAMRKFTKQEITLADYLEIAGSVLEPTTGLPAGTALRYFKMLTGSDIGESKGSGKI